MQGGLLREHGGARHTAARAGVFLASTAEQPLESAHGTHRCRPRSPAGRAQAPGPLAELGRPRARQAAFEARLLDRGAP